MSFSEEDKLHLFETITSVVGASEERIRQDIEIKLEPIKGTLVEHGRMLNVLTQDVRFLKQDVGQIAADVSSIRNHVQLISHDNIQTRVREDQINERIKALEGAVKELQSQLQSSGK